MLWFDVRVVTVRDGVAAILRGPNTHLNNLTHSPIKMSGLNVNKVDWIVGVFHFAPRQKVDGIFLSYFLGFGSNGVLLMSIHLF